MSSLFKVHHFYPGTLLLPVSCHGELVTNQYFAFSARDHLKHSQSLPKRQTLSLAKVSHHISYLGFHTLSMSLNQSYKAGFTKGESQKGSVY